MKKNLFKICIALMTFSMPLFAEDITFSSDSMKGNTGDKNGNTSLIGNAYILTSSMEISADVINLFGEDYSNISASGNVKGKNLDSGMDFTATELEYDRTTKIATLKGDVQLEDSENDMKAKARIIEYNSNTDIAIFQMEIDIRQKDNICSGSYAVYHKNEQFLELSGNAKVQQKDDTFRAQHIILNMDTQEITMSGRVKGTVTDQTSSKDKAASEAENENTVSDESETTPEQENSKTEDNTETSKE